MTITIVPFTVSPGYDGGVLSVGYQKAERVKGTCPPITYWGIYLDDKHISYTSSRELAEKTKIWMEKWLRQS